MDKAGNSTHYQKPLTIENKKPVITSVNMGTDVDGNGSVTNYTDTTNPGEYRSAFTNVGGDQWANSKIEYTTPAFRARGNRLAFDINTLSGNGTKNYKVYYAEEISTPLNSTAMVMGNVYTITLNSGNTDYRQYGAPMNSQGITFVATGAPIGTTGEVKRYTISEVATGTVNLSANTQARFTINTSTYPVIKDSDKTDGIVTSANTNKRYFIIKIYDQAVPQVELSSSMTAAPEWEQNAHAILVAMDIDNTDQAAPSINSAPFGQEYGLKTTGSNLVIANDDAKEIKNLSNDNYNKNIVLSGTERQGYVQYAYNTNGTIAAGTADISGKVIFLGKAADNQRIKNITVTIAGFNGGGAFTVAESPAGGGTLTSPRPTPADMGTGADAWYFDIVDQNLTLDYGHAINWEFGWDSSEVTNQVGTPTVTFTINDYRAAPTIVQSTRPVNIVPYISEIVTRLSGAYSPASAFARSANGWYPVYENEIITIKGFNLGTAPTVNINSTALTLTSVGKNEIKANVGAAATSGAMVVTVGTTNSINNSTRKLLVGTTNTADSNRVHYNWEPNGTNNNNLTNDRKLYIWNTGYVINDTVMLNPFMRMSDNGTRYVSFGRYVSYAGTNQGHLKVIVNNTGLSTAGAPQASGNANAAEGTVLYHTNRFINTTIGVTGDGDWATVASNITSGQSNLGLVYNRIKLL